MKEGEVISLLIGLVIGITLTTIIAVSMIGEFKKVSNAACGELAPGQPCVRGITK